MQPLIVRTTPSNGATEVPLNSTITIEYAAAVLTETVNVENFTVENLNSQTTIDFTISLNNTVGFDDGTIVVITPMDDDGWNGEGLNGLTIYRVTISDVVDAGGDAMTGAYTMQFTTVEDTQDQVDQAEEDAYVEESHELYGRKKLNTEEPVKSYTQLVEDNKKYIDWLMESKYQTAIYWDSPTYPAEQYVTAKSKYDLNFTKYTSILTSAQTKKLADLSVSYRSDLKNLESLLAQLKRSYVYWENILLGEERRSAPQVFRKGESVDATHDFHDRAIKNRSGEPL